MALDPQSVNAIIKSLCAAAGLDPAQYSAHGLRSGYLTQARARRRFASRGHAAVTASFRAAGVEIL
jgi:hypothetical protein